MIARFTKMVREGDENMMSRIEKLMIEREAMAEKNLKIEITKAEERISENITMVIKNEDKKLESKITGFCIDEINKTRDNWVKTSEKIETKLAALDQSHREANTELSIKLSVLTKKEDTHHNELTVGLAQLDELRTKVTTTSRKMEDLTETVSTELARNTMATDRKFEEIRTSMDATDLLPKETTDELKSRPGPKSENHPQVKIRVQSPI